AAGLHRKRCRGTDVRGEAWLEPRSTGGIPRNWRSQSRGGIGPWLSRGGGLVAIRSQRQGRRSHSARADLCLLYAGTVPAVSHGPAGKSAEGGACRRRADRGVRIDRFSGHGSHVAHQPDGFLRGGDRAWRRAASRDPARNTARCVGLGPDAVGARVEPHVAFLGRVSGTSSYSDLARHPENEPLPHVIAFRPEVSLLYVNADSVFESVSERLEAEAARDIRLIVCDLSASPHMDLAGARMLHKLHLDLARRGIALRIVGARGRVRDLLRAEGIDEKVGGLDRRVTLDDLLRGGGR